MKISACMIVKNEIETLPDCLKTLVGWVDEIVVVDTGSTDGTQYLLAAWAKVSKTPFVLGAFEWNGSFSDARNHAMSLASGDWLFTVDADDRCIIADWADMRRVLTHPDNLLGEFDIVAVNVLNVYGKRANIGSRIIQPRFLNAASKPYYEGAVHNQVKIGLDRPPNLIRTPFRIQHIGYGMLSKEKLMAKWERVLTMTKEAVDAQPESAFAWSNYAAALRNFVINGKNEMLPDLFAALDNTMKFSQNGHAYLYPYAVTLKGWIHYRQHEFERAEACAEEAMARKRDYLDAILLKAVSCADSERMDDAEFWCHQYLVQHKKFQYEDRADFTPTEQVGKKADVYELLCAIERAREDRDASRWTQLQIKETV